MIAEDMMYKGLIYSNNFRGSFFDVKKLEVGYSFSKKVVTLRCVIKKTAQ